MACRSAPTRHSDSRVGLLPAGPVLRDAAYGSAAARTLYPEARPSRSPVIGTSAPEQYERRDDIGQPRKRLRRG